tara:strand:- start:4362 stop:6716 length:2355 start_codon:yes stop_codon:yes gene_type:complete
MYISKTFSYLIKASISIFLVSIFFLFSAFWYFSAGLPDYKKLSYYEPSVLSRVYTDNGELVAEFALEKRLFIPYESIPEKVINSFLSAEDKNFFKHPGVDAKGVTRAVIKNIRNILSNKRLEGASTITQQVAKNFLLTNEVSLKRKIKEAILAFRIEKAFTKKRILELYLNEIYLGQGTYGVASASLEYFDKSVKELDYVESALLAALPKAPSKYNPFKSPELAKKRRNTVLNNLKANGYISGTDLKKFLKTEINLKNRKVFLLEEAKSYTEEVRRIVKTDYGFEKLYSQGLSISTPLDPNYQISALQSLRYGIEEYDRRKGWRGPIANIFTNENWKEILKKINLDPTLGWETAQVLNIDLYTAEIKFIKNQKKNKIFFKNLKWTNKKSFEDLLKIGDLIFLKKNKKGDWDLKQIPLVNGGIVVMNPYNGEVKALVGGYSYVSSEFNRATQAKRQPGSAFKPIVYAAALENGYLPNSLILDAPFVSEQGAGLKDWKPENYGKKFYGPSTLRKGIEKSRNLMTVRIAQSIGFEKIESMSKNLGVYDKIPELLSVSLGSNETTLLKLSTAYCSFVNGGKKVSPKMIKRIQDRRGRTIYNSEDRTCSGCEIFLEKNEPLLKILDNRPQVISTETAYQITSMLEGAVKRGTGKKLRNLKVPLAGKTGTTNDNYDAWFMGFTSNLVIGVYIGYDDPKSLGRYETGSKVALPVFKKFVETALYKEDFKPFKVPQGIYFYPVNYDTGEMSNFEETESIIESFKENSSESIKLKNLNFEQNYGKSLKFKGFY